MSAPVLAPAAMLRHDPRRGCWVLLAPERVLMLDEVTADVLRRLDGRTSVEAIAASLAADYDAPVATIAADVHELVDDLAARHLVLT